MTSSSILKMHVKSDNQVKKCDNFTTHVCYMCNIFASPINNRDTLVPIHAQDDQDRGRVERPREEGYPSQARPPNSWRQP